MFTAERQVNYGKRVQTWPMGARTQNHYLTTAVTFCRLAIMALVKTANQRSRQP
jgi:hypothetical protein